MILSHFVRFINCEKEIFYLFSRNETKPLDKSFAA